MPTAHSLFSTLKSGRVICVLHSQELSRACVVAAVTQISIPAPLWATRGWAGAARGGRKAQERIRKGAGGVLCGTSDRTPLIHALDGFFLQFRGR